MGIGLRVLKTVISVAISITLARLLRLDPAHFAGIISILAVQPSVFRSLHHSLSHIASALFAALFGIAVCELFGNWSIVIAAVSFVVMAIHIKLKRTGSLQLAVIVTINTMGTFSQLSGSAAYNQIMLVLIGMIVGTVVNVIIKPVHREREEVLLAKSESMLRVLLHYVRLDLKTDKMTPYRPYMRDQIEEVRAYIEKGKAVSQLIREDRWLRRGEEAETASLFDTYESMVERIRDMIKALQKADLNHPEAERLVQAITLTIHVQERMLAGQKAPVSMLLRSLHPDEKRRYADHRDLQQVFAYFQAYEALSEYMSEFAASQETAKSVSLKKLARIRKAASVRHDSAFSAR
ncbi:FUSC family protein [Paenibacillus sp. MBLB4367]|uniref:FUSC family protein n=1 Tax=Paenibacillus sp. MBLB4367 TaxID=3384767 RepID=UPI0039082651